MAEVSNKEEIRSKLSVSTATPASAKQQSRPEKKARKALTKLGLKQVVGITKIMIKKNPSLILKFENPEVFKLPHSDLYVFFGEVKKEEQTRSRDIYIQKLAEALSKENFSPKDDNPPVQEADEEDAVEDIDETGMDPSDIELVMKQTNVSRVRAVKALKANDNDLVNAIMELSDV
ncbi:nascent polypeptide-associated complex subunit alpha-like isoform X1 [Zophobas morio]|uniref:nascent polypeptide-associated complex subunit alpha-like isoform X1 n=1 Tax=Zophobas morio TaxID=2755281 RepID=UPI0030835556